MAIIYGIDPSLRHGAVVRTEWDGDELLLSAYLCMVWKKGDGFSVGLEDDISRLMILAETVSGALRSTIRAHDDFHPVVGIDWTPDYSFSRSPKALAKRMGYFMGYLSARINSMAGEVLFITPQELRYSLGLKGNCPKGSVWTAFEDSIVKRTPLVLLHQDNKTRDIHDAITITYPTLGVARSKGYV